MQMHVLAKERERERAFLTTESKLQLVKLTNNQIKVHIIVDSCTYSSVIIFKFFLRNDSIIAVLFKVREKLVENHFFRLYATDIFWIAIDAIHMSKSFSVRN